MFMRIAKAYEALTDETTKENWEKYVDDDDEEEALKLKMSWKPSEVRRGKDRIKID